MSDPGEPSSIYPRLRVVFALLLCCGALLWAVFKLNNDDCTEVSTASTNGTIITRRTCS
jgi:hypothetical protein